MEKLKITKEEELALIDFKRTIDSKGANPLEYRQKYRLVLPKWQKINRFGLDELSLLLHGWYEVEQHFKVGDWAYEKQTDKYLNVIQEYTGKDRTVSVSRINDFSDKVEKVTEPWKIMLLELGRDKPEFNPNDIIVTNSELYKADWLTDKEIIELYNEDLLEEFHAYENRIEVKGNADTQ